MLLTVATVQILLPGRGALIRLRAPMRAARAGALGRLRAGAATIYMKCACVHQA